VKNCPSISIARQGSFFIGGRDVKAEMLVLPDIGSRATTTC
jgi:hypothetical protein